MLNGISLFTGYAGIDIALSEYVRPVLYCEIERYAQAILLSRMDDGSIPFAPVWNDVTTLNGSDFKGMVDIIYGGFPCQDISVAGKGAGLEGKRSGLFAEIIRLAREATPSFIFLENVPAIRTRGAIEVQEALASIGYDARWTHLSASEVGANHKRERWFCLATNAKRDRIGPLPRALSRAKNERSELQQENGQARANDIKSICEPMANADSVRKPSKQKDREHSFNRASNGGQDEGVVSDSLRSGLEGHGEIPVREKQKHPHACEPGWWSIEPDLGRVANGVKDRSHRIKALGNGVVPLQVKTAFEALMGITN